MMQSRLEKRHFRTLKDILRSWERNEIDADSLSDHGIHPLKEEDGVEMALPTENRRFEDPSHYSGCSQGVNPRSGE